MAEINVLELEAQIAAKDRRIAELEGKLSEAISYIDFEGDKLSEAAFNKALKGGRS